jgi:hypothetical protein
MPAPRKYPSVVAIGVLLMWLLGVRFGSRE